MAVGPLSTKTRESTIEAELVRRVEALGGRCEKVTVLGSRGFFDRLVVLPGGKVAFVELKRPRGGRLALHQKLYADKYGELGATVALIKNSADIDHLLGASHHHQSLSEKRPNPRRKRVRPLVAPLTAREKEH